MEALWVWLLLAMVLNGATAIVVQDDQWYLLPEQYQALLEEQYQPLDRQFQLPGAANHTDRRVRQAVMPEPFPRMPFARPPPQFPGKARQARHPFGAGVRFPGVFGGVPPRAVRSHGGGVLRQPHAFPGKPLLSPLQLGKISQFLQLNVKPLHLQDVGGDGYQAHRFPGAVHLREKYPPQGPSWVQHGRAPSGQQGFPQLGKDSAPQQPAVSFQSLAPPARPQWETAVAQQQVTASEQQVAASPEPPHQRQPQWTDPGKSAHQQVGADSTAQQPAATYQSAAEPEGSSSQPAIKLIDPPALGPPHQLEQLRQQQQLQEQLIQQQQQIQQQLIQQQQRQRQLDQQQLEQQEQQQLQQQQQPEAQQVEEFVPPVPKKRATLKGILNQDCPTAEDDGYCASPPRYPSQQIAAAVKQCEGLLAAMYAPVPEDEDDVSGGEEEASERTGVVGNSTRDMLRGNRQVWSWARYNSSGPQGDAACSSDRRWVEPGYAREASSGRWYVVVQAGAALRQRVPVDECSAAGKACPGLLGGKCSQRGASAGFRNAAKASRCAQRHSHHHLITWDPDMPQDCPRMRVFRFPSACVCKLGVV